MNDITTATTIDLPPLLGTMQLEEDELNKPTQVPKRHYGFGPIFVSVCFHALGLYVLIEHRIEPPRDAATSSMPIHLQLVSPLQTPHITEPSQTRPIVPDNVLENTPENPKPVPTPQTLPPSLVDLPESPERDITIETVQTPLPESNAVAPTRLSVRQMVEQLRSEEERQSLIRICTPLQRLNPMFVCADEAASAFNNAQQDVGNSFFTANPGDTEAFANATRVGRIADSLRESGMTQSAIDRFLKEIDVTAQEKSTSGDARASALRDQMFLNDSTYQLKKRVLNP